MNLSEERSGQIGGGEDSAIWILPRAPRTGPAACTIQEEDQENGNDNLGDSAALFGACLRGEELQRALMRCRQDEGQHGRSDLTP